MWPDNTLRAWQLTVRNYLRQQGALSHDAFDAVEELSSPGFVSALHISPHWQGGDRAQLEARGDLSLPKEALS